MTDKGIPSDVTIAMIDDHYVIPVGGGLRNNWNLEDLNEDHITKIYHFGPDHSYEVWNKQKWLDYLERKK